MFYRYTLRNLLSTDCHEKINEEEGFLSTYPGALDAIDAELQSFGESIVLSYVLTFF